MLDAFGNAEGPVIADLVTELSADESARPLLSLVAVADGKVVGHVLFTRAAIERSGMADAAGAILAPLAVHPAMQSRGIGGRLIRTGLDRLASTEVQLVFVLGYPDYYTRHGFAPAGAQGFQAPYAIPEEHADAWMVQALHPGSAPAAGGSVRCARALDDPKYWRE